MKGRTLSQSTKPNVLIIDNDEGVVQAIATRLNSLGYLCIVARTGEQGVAAFNAGPIDLVITDLNMPVLDGVGLIRKIRDISEVPVIVVTGYRKNFHDQINAFDNVTVLEKPFPTEALVDLVEVELSLSPRRAA